MHHCVSTYAQTIESNISYIYTVEKSDGKKLATLEIGKNNNHFINKQLRGPCNANVSADVFTTVNREK